MYSYSLQVIAASSVINGAIVVVSGVKGVEAQVSSTCLLYLITVVIL